MTGWQIAGVVFGVAAVVIALVGWALYAGNTDDIDIHEGATQCEHEDPVLAAWTAPVPDLGSLDYRPGGES